MPTKCEDCGSPATAGQVPTKPGHHYCVDCASLETLELQGTNEKLDAPPPVITGGPAWPITAGLASGPALWQHQAMALKQLDQGLNTVVATPTASGKSLIFHLHTLTKLINDPGATTMVFYPTKALAHDQARRWQESCRTLELPDHTLGHIDGDVPMNRRDAIIRNARVLILTPDVCHAWLLRRANTPDVSTFLVNLQTIIIDEAHTYESVFGSNAAYLFRRLTSAAAAAGNPNPPQFIAATATILVPDRHLNQLTGRPFEVIKHSETGAPRFPRKVHHLMTAPGPTREIQLAQLITTIIDADPNAQVIAFHDSRQGVERVVQAINRPHSVMPYRAGYLATDRREIENKLRDNTIRAVIATNALELGIDMPDLNYGINLGVPPSRKQFHQRLGRIGRTQPGTFIILDTADAFSRHGDTLEHYYLNSVEHSHLYLNNEYVTFQQAQCLKAELEDLGRDTRTPPRECRWPTLFDQALKNAHGRPPPHLSEIDARTMSSAPQLAHNLRSSGEETLRITSASQGPDEARRFQKNIGSINFTKAITEAYPGAIYHHRGNSYRVEKWARKQQDNSGFIEVTKGAHGYLPHPPHHPGDGGTGPHPRAHNKQPAHGAGPGNPHARHGGQVRRGIP